MSSIDAILVYCWYVEILYHSLSGKMSSIDAILFYFVYVEILYYYFYSKMASIDDIFFYVGYLVKMYCDDIDIYITLFDYYPKNVN